MMRFLVSPDGNGAIWRHFLDNINSPYVGWHDVTFMDEKKLHQFIAELQAKGKSDGREKIG